ncbi:MAG: autotransporter domain-containing protein [Bergeyella sp.]
MTVGGEIRIAAGSTSTRWNTLEVRSGSLTSTDTVNGIVLSRAGTTAVQNSLLLLTGGTTTAEKITFGTTSSLEGNTGTVLLNGASANLYLGSGGIVLAATNTYTYSINLTAGTLGAKADWSSSLAMNLNGLADGTAVTIKAADASDTANDITLSGILSGTGGFTKTGLGTLTLSGANTYTGATLVSAGTLAVTGSLAATTVTVESSATLSGTGTIGGLVTVASGGAINLEDSAIGTLTLGGGLTLTGGSSLYFDLGTTSGSVDTIAVSGTYTYSGSGTITVTINPLDSDSVASGSYTLISGASGIDATNFTLASTSIGTDGYTATLVSSTGTSLVLVLTAASGEDTAYWTGDEGTSTWTVSNFSSDSAGTTESLVIGNATAVTFSASSADSTASVTADLADEQYVLSLTIAQTGSVDIGGSGTFHIGSGGITVDSGAGALTIDTTGGVYLDSVQTWTNDSTNTVTIDSDISGSALTLTGSGSGGFIFTGANTYAGGTAINGTTLYLQDGGSLLSTGAVSIDATGALDISGITDDSTTIGTLSGSGSVVLGDKTLITGTSSDSTFSGVISGDGGLTKQGSGTFTLSGANTYTGDTTVSAGTLEIASSGSLNSANTTVSSDASLINYGTINGAISLSGTLAGTGTVTGLVTTASTATIDLADGTINSMTLSGGLSLASGTVIQLDLGTTSGSVDTLLLSGAVLSSGTTTITFNSLGTVSAGTYVIIDGASSGLSADDFEIGSSFSGYTITLTSDGTNLILTLTDTSFSPYALTPNQLQVAQALDEALFNPDNYSDDLQTVTAAIQGLSTDQYPAAFDQISPALHSGALSLVNALGQGTAMAVHQNLNYRSLNSVDYSDPYAGDYLWDLWGQAIGYYNDGGISIVPGQSFESGTFLAGANRNLSHTTSIGIFGGYGDGSADYDNGSSVDITRQFIGGYLTYVNGGFYANFSAGGGTFDYDSKRRIQFGTIDRTASASADGTEIFGTIGGGYDFKFGDFRIGPQANLQRSSAKLKSFKEKGADSLNLEIEDTEYTSLQSQLGGRAAYTIQTSSSAMAIVPFVQAFWQHEFDDSQEDMNAKLDAGNGPGFKYAAEQGDDSSFVIGAGLSIDMGEVFQTVFSYHHDTANGGSNLFSGTVNWKF